MPLQNGYRPAYKSVASYSTDVVRASTYDDIIFKDEMGVPPMKNDKDLIIRGGTDGSEVALYAYVDSTEVAGKLRIKSYDEDNKKLYIVSINGATLPSKDELATELNRIYAQAVMKWEVEAITLDNEVMYDDNEFNHGESSKIAVYNKDQKAVVKAYKNADNEIDKDAYYLFFITKAEDKYRNIEGYMPLSYNIGFIYNTPNNGTIAHELGHGAFSLWHTFSGNPVIDTEGQTQNLMDYTIGRPTELWSYQWDAVHDPAAMVLGFLQDEVEGQALIEEFVDSNAGFGGSDALYNYLFVHKDEVIESLERHYIEGEINAEIAVAALYDFFDNRVNILNEQEALNYIISLCKYDVMDRIAKNKDEIFEELANITDEDEIQEVLLKKLPQWVRNSNSFAAELSKLAIHTQTINNVRKEIVIEELRIKLKTELTASGKKELLLKMSNKQYKTLLRNNGITKEVDIKRLSKLKRDATTGFYTDVDIHKVVSGLDDIQMSNVINRVPDEALVIIASKDVNVATDFRSTTSKLKIWAKHLETVGYTLDFAIALQTVASGGELEPADLLFMIPGASDLIKEAVDELASNLALGPEMWEYELPWDVIKNWGISQSNYNSKTPADFYEIPEKGALYLQYTEHFTKGNNSTIPTSFIFFDSNIASDVFGFTPVYVNYNGMQGLKGNIFTPQAQSSKIIW